LYFELDFPLGRRIDYEQKLKKKIENATDSKRFKLSDPKSKYLINPKKNMILTQGTALKVLQSLSLPLYDNFKVHFRDVITKLTRDALSRQTDVNEFESINENYQNRIDKDWKTQHKALRRSHKLQLDTGKHWAGIFIFNVLRSLRNTKK